MKLYYSPTSPFVRKVMVLLHEAGAVDRVERITGSGTAVAPGTAPIDVNPLGKVPTLITDEGAVLYDSHVICRYLADRFAPDLYPSGAAQWPALVQESTANGMMDAAYLMVMETRIRPEGQQFTDWIEGQWAKIARALDMLEAQVDDLEAQVTMGTLSLAAALGYLDLRHGDRDWRAGHPRLAAWETTMAARPSLVATRPPA